MESPMPICTGVRPTYRVKKTTLPVRKVPMPRPQSAFWKDIIRGRPGGGRIFWSGAGKSIIGGHRIIHRPETTRS
ncbi:hypothetical protein GCM10010168_88930 [Actinoplanes ianthinogenes]|nr:hypothetical protein GCM10010168_88930 [Actinoplanes ianthinogenes]